MGESFGRQFGEWMSVILEVSLGERPLTDSKPMRIIPHIVFFLAGSLLLLALFGLFYYIKAPGTVFQIFLGLMFFGIMMLATEGWPWFSQYKFGSMGSLIKYMALLFIGITMVGLLPFAYWTGRGVFKLVAKFAGYC